MPYTYARPVAGQPVTSIIAKGLETPRLKIKFSNVFKPFFYPNSPEIPRWSITCTVDPDQHQDFIDRIHEIEDNENIVNSPTFRDDVYREPDGQLVKTGFSTIKFQTADKILIVNGNEENAQPFIAKQEFPFNSEVMVVFDVMRYTKRHISVELNKGISYQPKLIYFYPESETEGK